MSHSDDQPLAPTTLCNHPRYRPVAPDNRPLTPPIYQSVKFTVDHFDELKKIFKGEREGYFYSRISNPTCALLERTLAELQGTEAGRVTGTGIAAVTGALLGLLKAGDTLLYFIESYAPSRVFAETMLKRFGIDTIRISQKDEAGIREAMARPTTKAVLFESISNPLLKAAPMKLIVDEAKKHGVLTVLDNTFAQLRPWPGLSFDLIVHSLTKYANGHGDVMGGAILGTERLLRELDKSLSLLGTMMDPLAASQVQRGLKTYHLRRRAAVENAEALASWLTEHPAVEEVVYPGLSSHPQHAWFREMGSDFGSMIFLKLKDKRRSLEPLVTRGRVFQLAGSLGSTESLIAPVLMMFGNDLSPEERGDLGIDGSAIRLSIGIEDIEDLKKDMKRILA